MMAIFSDIMEMSIEVFIGDFFVVGTCFDKCLDNLELVLKRCEETNLVLNWEKCLFMVKRGIVLGHRISEKGIEVDRAKIVAIKRLTPPTNVKEARCFLGHVGFYRRFIKDFSKVKKPLSNLFIQGTPFDFDDECQRVLFTLKDKLVTIPIMVAPNWNLPLELMCDASNYVVGAVLG